MKIKVKQAKNFKGVIASCGPLWSFYAKSNRLARVGLKDRLKSATQAQSLINRKLKTYA